MTFMSDPNSPKIIHFQIGLEMVLFFELLHFKGIALM